MAKKDQLNKQADDWIYTQNNKDSAPGEIDLHGLYVKEGEKKVKGHNHVVPSFFPWVVSSFANAKKPLILRSISD